MTIQHDRPFFVSFDDTSEDDKVRDIVDRAYRQMRRMIQTHYREDIIKLIDIAHEAEVLGYTLVWIKPNNCVGARRKSDGYIVKGDGRTDVVN